jgi:hypothetical protein
MGKPKPFSRPSISLGGAPVEKKEWKSVPVGSLRVGDLILGHGAITRLYEVDGYYFIETPSYLLDDLHPSRTLQAFVETSRA